MSTKPAIYVPLVTPLNDAGEVCKTGVSRLLANTQRHVTGFIACLTSGEGWLLDEARWEAMLRTTLSIAGSKRVIAGIERPTTAEAVRYAIKAQKLGAEAVMFPMPFGAAVTQAEMIAHFAAVHEATDLNLYIYNETSLSQNTAHLDTLLEIARLARVVGIKDSPPELRTQADIDALRAHGLVYYLGWEHWLSTGLDSDGQTVSLANLEPAVCYLAARSSDPAIRAFIGELTVKYGLDQEDWYRHIKEELMVRGVLASNRTVEVEVNQS
ncbi:dihydrodipicolinate synthase family protein [Burkholderia sp. JP2-270]|uniref:dihydrodipicolinate synthase family protein n=1 Tax=Burkholderia sp. JP2-270 TaxID=2217913 RepID=UPI000DA33D38|nr:dihydrodipicolinate synthase family protein [Burkholderia sp. JP2-270]AWV00667.1 dihydrodipicolinate synthase family protein [Burkholderia sp. JP2-270]